MQIKEHIINDISNYGKWFNKLDPVAAAKVTVALARIEAGLKSIKWFDGIGEYKIDYGPGYRIYLGRDGANLIILYGGGSKCSQQDDIEKAKALHAKYKATKRATKKLPIRAVKQAKRSNSMSSNRKKNGLDS